MNWSDLKWTLASGSPRREMLLRQIGIEPAILPTMVEEVDNLSDPTTMVRENARRKMEAAASEVESGILLAADTVVAVGGKLLGKPSDAQDAEWMLKELSNRWHEVYTGFAISWLDRGLDDFDSECTRVLFRNLTDEEVKSYISSGEPLDKAGAYGIQGIAAGFVSRIEGCYFNVIGLPLAKVLDKVNLWLTTLE